MAELATRIELQRGFATNHLKKSLEIILEVDFNHSVIRTGTADSPDSFATFEGLLYALGRCGMPIVW